MCPCQNEGLAVLSKVSPAGQENWFFPSAQHWWSHTPGNSSNSYTDNQLQEKPRHTGASLVMEYQDDQRTWEPLRWGEAVRGGIVQPGKEEVWDHLNNLRMSSEADLKCPWTVCFGWPCLRRRLDQMSLPMFTILWVFAEFTEK